MAQKPITSLFSSDQTKKAQKIFRALNHKLRVQILDTINSEGKIVVTEIYVRLRLEQSVASQHLKILRDAGLVTTQRDGKFVFYSVNLDRLAEIAQAAKDLTAKP